MTPLTDAYYLYSNYPYGTFEALDEFDATHTHEDADTIDVQTYDRVAKCWRACRTSVESYL